MKKASSTIKSPAKFISQSKLECVQPTMVPGLYDFLIQINWDMSNIAGELFVYSLFQLLRIVPIFGPTDGGILTTLIGNDFPNSTTLCCKYGKHILTQATFISSTQIKCKSPKLLTSTQTKVEVAVSTNSNDFVRGNNLSYTNTTHFKPENIGS